MSALFPGDVDMARRGWECHPDPEARLSQQPKRERIGKRTADYVGRRGDMEASWPGVRQRLAEAGRFSDEFLLQVPAATR